jgi:hypothetical protein
MAPIQNRTKLAEFTYSRRNGTEEAVVLLVLQGQVHPPNEPREMPRRHTSRGMRSTKQQ